MLQRAIAILLLIPAVTCGALPATTVWEIRTDGSPTNGGGYKSNAGTTDYSQQAAAQLSVSDAACVTGGTTVTSATGGFTAAMVGNVCYLAGTHFVTGWYEITGYTNTNTIAVDRDPTNGTNGSSGTLNVGGALNNIGTMGLVLSTAAQSVAGMKCYIREGTYNLTGTTVNTDGGPLDLDASQQDSKAFYIKGYDAGDGRDAFTGTRPVIDANAQAVASLIELKGTYAQHHTIAFVEIDGDKDDTAGSAKGILGNSANWDNVISCYVHECDGNGIDTCKVVDTKVASCGGDGFYRCNCFQCFADSNSGDGFDLTIILVAVDCVAKDNGIGFQSTYSTMVNCTEYSSTTDGYKCSHHSTWINCVSYGAGGYAFNTQTSSILQKCASDGGASGHTNATPLLTDAQIVLTADPFTNAALLDFSLNTTAGGGAVLRAAGLDPYGQTGYLDIGAVQHADPTVSGGETSHVWVR